MYIEAQTLDDLMYITIQKLLDRPFNISASRGDSSEIISALLHLENPRARLSITETKGKLFSALGELLWYLSKTNELDFIVHYVPNYISESEDGKTIYGGYGPRLFSWREKSINQVDNVINLLKKKPFTRRAVIQLFDAEDIIEDPVEIPCTCTLQFMIRDSKLHLFTSMRSNDAFIGLPHDVFTFTMLQEIMARTLNVDLGSYSHAVGSLHLYKSNIERAQQYIREGIQSTKVFMPEMPINDPWPSIAVLLEAESKIRAKDVMDISKLALDPYWLDLVRLLRIHSFFKEDNFNAIKNVKEEMHCQIYNSYIEKKIIN